MKSFFKLSPIFLAGILLFSCSDDDNKTPLGDDQSEMLTIAEFVENNPDSYSVLGSALEATGLLETVDDPDANLTVFAPDNTALNAFLVNAGFQNGIADVDTEEEKLVVKNILLNHVLGEEVKSPAIISSVPLYVKNLATGPKNMAEADTKISAFINLEGESVVINGGIKVSTPDAFDASNGIIHAIDGVIAIPTINDFVLADARVSELKDALISTNLVNTTADLEKATILAPLNSAFMDLDPAPAGDDLNDALLYHVINNLNAEASDVVSLIGSMTPITVQGQSINVEAGPKLKGNGNTENSGLVITDIQASNGVIHVIDRVLLPATATP